MLNVYFSPSETATGCAAPLSPTRSDAVLSMLRERLSRPKKFPLP